MKEINLPEQPQRSLRSILIGLFLLFSVAPLVFATLIYYINSERALNAELLNRLDGNTREINLILEDYKSVLVRRSQKIKSDRTLLFYISSRSFSGLTKFAKDWMETGVESSVSFFNYRGQMLSTTFRGGGEKVESKTGDKVSEFFLPEDKINALEEKQQMSSFATFFDKDKKTKYLTLLHYVKIFNQSNRLLGYAELAINLSHSFLDKLKSRLDVDLGILDKNGEVIISSQKDFLIYPKNFFHSFFDEIGKLSDIEVRGENFGYTLNRVSWENEKFFLLVGASKKSSEKLRREFFFFFLFAVLVIVFFMVIISVVTSRKIVRPINDLVIALRIFREEGKTFDVEKEEITELGVLTSVFSKMSHQVASSQSELKEKIVELEETNYNLHETRTQLVHSAKMASLGQLVAGVAHELNNPIGFIYSNMVHLKQYSQDLLKLAELKLSEKDKEVEEIKKNIDFDYISKDLPKLITSCEDGARRIKDIVLGLRNFSRLDESEEKEVNIHKCLEETLRLLDGEIKNRVRIHKDFGDIPQIMCSPSEINQVFMNILSNAVQAISKEGEIWIITEIDNEGMVGVLIRDNGKGMTDSTRENIFDPFFTTKMVGQGTGLGLSISHGIIEKHGGSISVQSEAGEGTTFTIKLPIR